MTSAFLRNSAGGLVLTRDRTGRVMRPGFFPPPKPAVPGAEPPADPSGQAALMNVAGPPTGWALAYDMPIAVSNRTHGPFDDDNGLRLGTGLFDHGPWYRKGTASAVYGFMDPAKVFYIDPTNPIWATRGYDVTKHLYVDAGALCLAAYPVDPVIADLLPADAKAVSTWIQLKSSVNWKGPAYVEGDIQFPAGQGVWPALWTLRADKAPWGSTWATDTLPEGEDDIAEFWKRLLAWFMNGILHGDDNGAYTFSPEGGQVSMPFDPTADYHKWASLTLPAVAKVVRSYDRTTVWKTNEIQSAWTEAFADWRYPLFTMGLGANFEPSPFGVIDFASGATPTPAVMKIRSFKVYLPPGAAAANLRLR